ncbi:unnamed protein product [Durusdinium trenchii]|uniref:Uncharacterized protein n=1 Tax=Durusdinium trenchii TaxID=1381693 RepID=A0ABP0J1Z4_9DINO
MAPLSPAPALALVSLHFCLGLASAAPGKLAVDSYGRLVPVQEHVSIPSVPAMATSPVIRKVASLPVPTDWPKPLPKVPAPDPAPDATPELAREAQISRTNSPSTAPPLHLPEAAHISSAPVHGTDLLVLTSGAFLLPAHVSGRAGLQWYGMIFSLQALICGVYHYCDQHRVGTELSGPVCSETSYRFWHLSDHGMAYFVMLQMGFLLLGPEDPMLRRLVPWGDTVRLPGPLQTVFVTRLVPSILLILLVWRGHGDHSIGSPIFHLLLGGLCCLLFLFAQSTFWLFRPGAAAQALFLKQSWLRLALCSASVILSLMMFVAMQRVANDQSKVGMGGAKAVAHSAWHVATAVLACGLFQVIQRPSCRYEASDFQGQTFKEMS